MSVEFIRHEMLTNMDGKKFLKIFCLVSLLMTFGIDAAFPDLSKLVISVYPNLTGYYLQIKHPFNADRVQVLCERYQQTGDNETKITCEWNSFISMTIVIVTEGKQYDIPINVTCGYNRKPSRIEDLYYKFIGNSSAFLSWNKTTDIDHYLVIVMDGQGMRLMTLNAQSNTFNISGLMERTSYQICIASIDKTRRTSDYVCLTFDTNFTTTGLLDATVSTTRSRLPSDGSAGGFQWIYLLPVVLLLAMCFAVFVIICKSKSTKDKRNGPLSDNVYCQTSSEHAEMPHNVPVSSSSEHHLHNPQYDHIASDQC